MKTNKVPKAKHSLPRMTALGIFALTLALAGFVNGWASDEGLKQSVQSDTERLMAAAALPANAADTSKTLLGIAQRRQTAMLALMERTPATALQYALSAEQRNQLPPDVRAHVEEAVSVTGTLEVLGRLDENGRTGMEYYLDLNDTRLQIFAEDMSDDYLTGAVVTVNGLRLADRLAADPKGITLVEPSSYLPGENGNGVRYARALVININFSDLGTQPWTVARANDVFNGSITPWFAEASYGHFSFDADIAGWYTIAASSRTCSANTFRDQAEAMARADGFNPSAYQHVVIAFPRVAACSWAGLGQVPGRYTWLNNAMGRGTAVHELGHNLGLSHSHSKRCTGGPLSDPCTTAEYGDRFDVMGSGGNVSGSTISYHGTYKNYLGWIPNSDVIALTPADGAALVTLNSVETDNGPRVLRVARPGTNEFFTIEMREPIGIDAGLSTVPYLLTGVPIYQGTSTRNQWIIDIAYQTTTILDAPLQVGDTFYDPTSDLNITLFDIGGGQATIYVSYAP